MAKRKGNKSGESATAKRRTKARRWLAKGGVPGALVATYAQRYGVTEAQALDDLYALGYKEDVDIQAYERDGVEWEYKVDPLSGEMYVVPAGTSDYELQIHYICG